MEGGSGAKFKFLGIVAIKEKEGKQIGGRSAATN